MSFYAGFDLVIDNDDGTVTPLASATVKVYDATNSVALADLASDPDGHVVAGSLAVAVGTLVRFRVENYQGRAAYAEQVTT